MSIKTVKVHSYEKGLLFRSKEFRGLLDARRHYFVNPVVRDRIDVVDLRDPWLNHRQLDLIVKSGALKDKAEVLDLQDFERALVWVDGRFQRIVSGGLYALWTSHRKVRVQIIDAREVLFNHPDISVILKSDGAKGFLQENTVAEDHVGVLFRNGQYIDTLSAGRYVFWKDIENVNIFQVSMSEQSLDITGQEIMTADKVTLRLNAVIAYNVIDAQKAVRYAKDVDQSLYREAQLALRAIVGSRQLDELLADKDTVAVELKDMIAKRAESFGLKIVSLGIRDVILPGEMKELLNKVTEAKKAAEANLISRREETAAMRSQANTAKLLENNPVLMRLRELEVLESISNNSKMSVVLGEKGLADRVVNLL
jgi:regulator of protease activity HflC (stomatin/prohibitin superfamily)